MYADFVGWITGPNVVDQNQDYVFYSGTDLGIPVEIAFKSYADAGNLTEGPYTTPLLCFGDTNGPDYYKICDNWFARMFLPSGTEYNPTNKAFLLACTYPALDVVPNHAGAAAELRERLNFDTQALPRDRGTLTETSCIPTSAMAIERAPLPGLQTVIVSYMSVVNFDGAGAWRTNYGGYAFSQDFGYTWAKPARSRWYNTDKYDDPWQMATIARKNQYDQYLYVFGTPNGRYGGAKISRVEQHRILDVSAYPNPYRYWDGASWSQDRNKAVDVVPAPVGEASVMWHAATNQWLMGYLNELKAAIVVRTAPQVWGPWSDESIVVTSAQYPQLYGCFFMNRTSFNATPYFMMSQFGPYNVRMMRLHL